MAENRLHIGRDPVSPAAVQRRDGSEACLRFVLGAHASTVRTNAVRNIQTS